MKVDYVRKLLAVTVAASLLLVTGCGAANQAGTGMSTSGEAGPLSSVKLTPGGDDTSDPTVTFDAPLEATKAGATVLLKGGGDVIKENQTVTYKAAIFKTEDGSLMDSNFSTPGAEIPTTEEMKKALPDLHNVMVGNPLGSYIAFIEAPVANPGAPTPDEAPAAQQMLVLKPVSAVDIPAALPAPEFTKSDDKSVTKATATIAEDGKIAVTLPPGKADPAKLEVTVLKEGDGPVATKDSTVVAHYIGARLEDGKVFDGSYSRGEPSEFPLSGVIKGWTEGLTGIKQGSTVLLSIPTDKAYGANPQSEATQGPLVFIVELKEVK